jgi:acetylornithine deacetylase
MQKDLQTIYQEAVELLKSLIAIPSISREEGNTAKCLSVWLEEKNIKANFTKNNVWAKNKYFDDAKQTILLLSHHDTVKPAQSYKRDPFMAEVEDGKLYGLGSNDAGGPLVTLLSLFVYFNDHQNLPFNLIVCAAAEEEVSGKDGIELALKEMPNIDFAIVGEPTSMQAAISEKGLMVCDCTARGKAGHAARDEGINAITIAMKDIAWVNSFNFPKSSEVLGPVKMTVAIINGGIKHNVVPERCEFVIDVRTTDAYSNAEVLGIMQQHMQSEVKARSTRLNPSKVSLEHPFIKAIKQEGVEVFGSSTMSDQALLKCPSVKFSPGDSARSHTADEFIYLDQIKEGIEFFIPFFKKLINQDGFKIN